MTGSTNGDAVGVVQHATLAGDFLQRRVDLAGRDLTGDELGAITNYVNTVMGATLPALRALINGTATPDSAMTMVFGNS